jgi:hypothetical protein
MDEDEVSKIYQSLRSGDIPITVYGEHSKIVMSKDFPEVVNNQ